ncbi:MAG: PEP-CTERM sorting domain-containing protein [Gemmataceae bacterium]
MSRLYGLAVGLAAFLALAPLSRAGMIPTQVTVTPDGGNFRWTYGVVVSTDVNVNPGDSFTIYDFAGLVNGSVGAPAGWSGSVANSGPSRTGTSPNDDPAFPNLTFTYTGASPLPGQQELGSFWALSTEGTASSSEFTSTAHRQSGGRAESNVTTTDAPASASIMNTPEPAALLLAGIGLPLVGLARCLRRKQA